MVLARRARLVVALLALAALAGCYGQTDYASRIGSTAATFNARGTTDHGPADVWFEYWKTATPADRQTTTARTIPGGVKGAPFSQRATGLETGVPYSYRLCGQDTGGGPSLCAQTRNLVPGTDNVQASGSAWFTPGGNTRMPLIDIDAWGPTGGHAYYDFFVGVGSIYPVVFPIGTTSNANVTCVAVYGDSAVIGLDPWVTPVPGSVMAVQLFDLGPAGSGLDRISSTGVTGSNRSRTDCSQFTSAQYGNPMPAGDVAISAAEPQPTLR